MKLVHALIVTIMMSLNAVASQQCQDLFKQKPHEMFKQLLESKSPSQLLRSNAEQYWAWAKLNAENYFKNSVDILTYEGRVVGDPHNKNFGLIPYMKKLIWTVVDADDAGTAPFILDFARYVAAIKAVSDVKTKVLWNSYVAGLSGQEVVAPPIVAKYLNLTFEQYRELEVKKANKFADATGLKLLNNGVESSVIQNDNRRHQIKAVFEKAFSQSNWQVLDVGGREKDRGGSKEALRFVALVREDDGRINIFELKEDLGTSVDQFKQQVQDNLLRTLDDYIYSRSESHLGGYDPSYQVVRFKFDGNEREFLLRRKQLYFFDAANSVDTKKEEDEFYQLSIYNAWFMGRLHSGQKASRTYVSAIRHDQNGIIVEGVKQLVKSYLDLLVFELKDAKKRKGKMSSEG